MDLKSINKESLKQCCSVVADKTKQFALVCKDLAIKLYKKVLNADYAKMGADICKFLLFCKEQIIKLYKKVRNADYAKMWQDVKKCCAWVACKAKQIYAVCKNQIVAWYNQLCKAKK